MRDEQSPSTTSGSNEQHEGAQAQPIDYTETAVSTRPSRKRRGHGRDPLPWLSLDYGRFQTDENALTLDRNAPSTQFGDARTGFDPSDAADSDRWEWLEDLNNGRGDSDRRAQRHADGIRRDTDVICDRLGATEYQQERAEYLLNEIDIEDELLPSGPIEIAILGVVSVVIDEDRTRYGRGANTNVVSVLRDDRFDELLEDFGVQISRVYDVRRRLRETSVYESPN